MAGDVGAAALLNLVSLAHESASNPAQWIRFLEHYSRHLHADVAVLQRHDLAERSSTLLSTFGMTSRFTDSYNKYYGRLNVWREHGVHLYQAGRVVIDEQMYPRKQLKATEFYNDFLVRNGGTHCVTGIIARSGPDVVTVSALRADAKSSFHAEDVEVVDQLLPHLMRAHVTARQLHTLEAGEGALDALSLGIVLLSTERRVVYANTSAERMIRTGDGLVLRDNRLVASTGSVDDALQRLLEYAALPGTSSACPADVLLARPVGRPYHVTAAPLRRRLPPFLGMPDPVAIVIITDPERHRPIGPAALKLWFGLTMREAALTTTLLDGHTLDQAAEQLEMRYETARTHLRRILSKTGTSRQTDLVLLLERVSQQTLADDAGDE